jgi:hypothetical protein
LKYSETLCRKLVDTGRITREQGKPFVAEKHYKIECSYRFIHAVNTEDNMSLTESNKSADTSANRVKRVPPERLPLQAIFIAPLEDELMDLQDEDGNISFSPGSGH